MVEPGSRTPFQQPVIGIEKQAEFAQLQSALDRVFGASGVEGFLRLLQT